MANIQSNIKVTKDSIIITLPVPSPEQAYGSKSGDTGLFCYEQNKLQFAGIDGVLTVGLRSNGKWWMQEQVRRANAQAKAANEAKRVAASS